MGIQMQLYAGYCDGCERYTIVSLLPLTGQAICEDCDVAPHPDAISAAKEARRFVPITLDYEHEITFP